MRNADSARKGKAPAEAGAFIELILQGDVLVQISNRSSR